MLPSQDEYSAHFIPVDTIVDSGRVLRKPMREWGGRLLPIIQSCSESRATFEMLERGCAALNNAALMFAHAGLVKEAEQICHDELNWIRRSQGVYSDAELSVLAIHPWINLGRLCRRSHQYDRALKYFLALDTSQRVDTVSFGQWEARVSTAFREAAEPVYVYERLRTHLLSGDLDQAVDFADSFGRPLLKGTLMLKAELLIHVYLRQDKPLQFMSLIRDMAWPEDQFGVLAKQFYVSVALNAIRKSQSCSKTLRLVAPHCTAQLRRPDLDSRNLRLAIEVCRLAGHLGLREVFGGMLSEMYAAVPTAGDVPFASQLLSLGKQYEHCGPVGELAAVEDFVMSSGYKTSSFVLPEISQVLAELKDAISRLLCVSACDLCA